MENAATRLKPLFLLDPSITFLNHGSFGACPAEVLEAAQRWQREMERNPVEFQSRRSAGLLREAREALGALLGTAAANLVFMPNATTAVNTVIQSLPLAAGDEILTMDHEYGACEAAWDHVAGRVGARRVAVPVPLPFDAAGFTERIWSAVTPRTRVLFLSHLSSQSALIFPIAELIRRAREAGIVSVIDGAHVPGQLPLDLDALGADFYAGNCHKWLCAPKGAAFLYARPERQALLHATTISWGYHAGRAGDRSQDAYLGETPFERRLQWQGTRDITPWLSVPAAIDFQRRHGWDAVRADCHARAVRLLERACALTGLAPIGRPDDFGQMVPIPVPAMDGAALKARLFDEFRIEVPVTSHGGQLFVRASFQGYNGDADADALLDALATIYRLAPRQAR
ncbi:aminotransferase class V-fold PLP-dependent enzyme [Pelomonas sp. KK5]|uniref:aminotransferase class V-fold PLP-dependent enzyme n=1 Tax=Pelomonas sp. KK5 TaxID=1855730 RepID=UPI00097C9455|nr:aminotransferase class V-fold PLP-dependent enzyme [Pelomonas sp. KK5]